MSDMYFGQIMAYSDDANDIGETVTFTPDTGSAMTGTIGSDGYCRQMLPAFRRYVVTLGSFTSDPINMGCGQNHYVDCSLTTQTWSGIKRIINAHKAADYIATGDTFPVELTSGETLNYIACVNTYGLDEVDFIPDKLLATTYAFNGTVGTNWDACSLRSMLNNSFISTLPVDLAAVISNKTLLRGISGAGGSTIESTDKIWIPTEREATGVKNYAPQAEFDAGRQYPIFPNATSRIRSLSGGTANNWDLSTMYSSANNCGYINIAGNESYQSVATVTGVLPCFRIAPDTPVTPSEE